MPFPLVVVAATVGGLVLSRLLGSDERGAAALRAFDPIRSFFGDDPRREFGGGPQRDDALVRDALARLAAGGDVREERIEVLAHFTEEDLATLPTGTQRDVEAALIAAAVVVTGEDGEFAIDDEDFFADVRDQLGGGGTVGGGFARLPIDVPEGASTADVLDAVLRAVAEAGPLEGAESDFATAIASVGRAVAEARELENGRLTLNDGTVISLDDIENMDPLIQAQMLQAFRARQDAIENQNGALLNAYNLGEFDRSRQQVADTNAAETQAFLNRSAEFRNQVAVGDLSIEQATAQIDRMLEGLGESRARAKLELDTLRAAAPFGTVRGKTAFTGADLGAGVTELLRQAGVEDPENAVAINFPGTITLDPAAVLRRGDEALGVTGELPPIPDITLGPEDVPGAPSLTDPGSITLPNVVPPVLTGAITLPEDFGQGGAVEGPPVAPVSSGSAPTFPDDPIIVPEEPLEPVLTEAQRRMITAGARR